jgi:membrane-associated phospholipid phosphatase
MAPLVPARMRPWLLALLVGMVTGFVLLAVAVWHGHLALGFDQTVQRALGVPDWSQRANQHLGDAAADLGSGPAVLVGSLALAVAVYHQRGRDWAALGLTAIALPVALIAERVVKPLVGRRYYGTGYRFPSGHAATVTAVVVVAWLLLGPAPWVVRSRVRMTAAALAGVAVIGAVSWGLLVIRAHSPIDIMGGWLFGGAVTLGAAALLDTQKRVVTGGQRAEEVS